MSLESLLTDLLTPVAPVAPADLDGWWAAHDETPGDFAFDRAVRSARRFERLGWAFASGYTEALCAIAPGLGDERVALAVSEAGGTHPGAIEARLDRNGDHWALTGTKTFVTLGAWARKLVVLAREGERDLVLVVVPANRPGVHLEARPPLPFVPEIPHAVVRFEGVHVGADERLPGDGWADWVRPFRTVEDLHVHGAAVASLVGIGLRYGWPEPTVEGGVGIVAGLRTLAHADPSDPAVHVALAGLIAQVDDWVGALEPAWADVPDDVREAFARDRRLMRVASEARERRRARAWQRLRGE